MKDPLAYVNSIKEILNETDNNETDNSVPTSYGFDFMAKKSVGPKSGNTIGELKDAVIEKLVPDIGISYNSPSGFSMGVGPTIGKGKKSINFGFRKEFDDGGIATPKRGLVDGPGSYSKPQKIGGEVLKAKNLAQRTEIDGWLNNWLDDNFKNYGVRNREKFLKDLKRDWKKAKKTEFKNNRLAQSGDLPTVTPKTTTGRVKPGDSGKVFKENKVFYKNFGEHLVAGNEIEKDRFYRRLFFAGQIETNPKLKKDIDNYFKTVTLNKGRRFGFTDAELKKAYEVMTSNPDVPFILSADSGIDTSMKQTLFKKRFKSYQPYRQKTAMSSLKYIENIKKLEKITGIQIKKNIAKEQSALKKILDVSSLPDELKYSIDHLYGVAEAVKNPKDKKFAIQVANNLIGGTVFQNTNAGFGGYSVKRKSLINNINQGKNVTKSLNKLNELTTEFYPKFKNLKQPYKIVNGELTFAKGFKGETQSERFTSYAKEIDKTKQGKQLIKKQYGSLKNLIKEIKNVKNFAAKKGFELNSFAGALNLSQANINIPPSVRKSLTKIVSAGKTLGKAAVVIDPLFATMDFSKAMGEGLSGKESASYTGQKFLQDIANLPRTLEDLAYVATDKGTFKNFGEKENRLFSYEPAAFADRYIQEKIEATPEATKDFRKARIDYAKTLPIIDDMDIPLSQSEAKERERAFYIQRGVEPPKEETDFTYDGIMGIVPPKGVI